MKTKEEAVEHLLNHKFKPGDWAEYYFGDAGFVGEKRGFTGQRLVTHTAYKANPDGSIYKVVYLAKDDELGQVQWYSENDLRAASSEWKVGDVYVGFGIPEVKRTTTEQHWGDSTPSSPKFKVGDKVIYGYSKIWTIFEQPKRLGQLYTIKDEDGHTDYAPEMKLYAVEEPGFKVGERVYRKSGGDKAYEVEGASGVANWCLSESYATPFVPECDIVRSAPKGRAKFVIGQEVRSFGCNYRVITSLYNYDGGRWEYVLQPSDIKHGYHYASCSEGHIAFV